MSEKPSDRIRAIYNGPELGRALSAVIRYLDERDELVHPIARVNRRMRPEHPGIPSDDAPSDRCGCDEAKALRAELDELRAAAYALLPWIDRSLPVARDGARRLELALAAHPEPKAKPSRCAVTTVFGLSGARCELPTGHAGHHRWCQIEWR